MSAEYDPHAEGTDMALLDQLMGMAHHQCKNFDDTYHAVKKFKKLLDQYNVVTKEHPLR